MPQMASLMWMPLFVLFSLIFLTSMAKIYFSTYEKPDITTNKVLTNKSPHQTWTW